VSEHLIRRDGWARLTDAPDVFFDVKNLALVRVGKIPVKQVFCDVILYHSLFLREERANAAKLPLCDAVRLFKL
jgi:hypothetical protein